MVYLQEFQRTIQVGSSGASWLLGLGKYVVSHGKLPWHQSFREHNTDSTHDFEKGARDEAGK